MPPATSLASGRMPVGRYSILATSTPWSWMTRALMDSHRAESEGEVTALAAASLGAPVTSLQGTSRRRVRLCGSGPHRPAAAGAAADGDSRAERRWTKATREILAPASHPLLFGEGSSTRLALAVERASGIRRSPKAAALTAWADRRSGERRRRPVLGGSET